METNLPGLTWRRCAHDSEHTVVDCVRTSEPDSAHDIEFHASYIRPVRPVFAAIATKISISVYFDSLLSTLVVAYFRHRGADDGA